MSTESSLPLITRPEITSKDRHLVLTFGAAIFLCSILSVRAATEHWIGVPGVSATTNWTDGANWSAPQQTYYNQVQFLGTGGNPNNSTAINNVLDATTGVAQVPIWQLDYNPTNLNYTTLINPGVTLTLGAGNGNWTVGADQNHTAAPATANAVEVITLIGPGATINVGGTLYVNQGSPSSNDTHNITLDLSQVDTFTDNGPGASKNNEILVASGGAARTHGTLYLAKTNTITLGNDFQICNQSSSNSEPCAVYLGIYNYIRVGSGNLVVGGTGTTAAGASLQFNPAFLSGPVPTAYFGSTNANGRMANFLICNENGGAKVSGSASVDLSGGALQMMVTTMQVAESSGNGAAAQGTLTFDDGSINVNNATVGNQTASAAAAGGPAVGVINLNTNALLAANADLIVNNTLTLASVTGTAAVGTAGLININGGALSAGVISNGLGNGAISVNNGSLTVLGAAGAPGAPISSLALTNSVLQLNVALGATSVSVTSMATGGSNVVNIISAPAFPTYPARVSLLSYAGSVAGAGYNFVLGSLPPLCEGYLSNDTALSSVDLVLTSGPVDLTWSGAVSGNWDYTTTNWSIFGVTYADGDNVFFNDSASDATVNLTATFAPDSVTVSNSALPYQFTGPGSLTGSGGLTKQGSGTFIIDNNGNSFGGGITIGGGTLQIGNNDTSGSLAGGVTDNGVLAFDRVDSVAFSSAVSGSGSVVENGAGATLELTGSSTFTGNVAANNNSTVQAGSGSAFGSGTNGSIIIANGSTLDPKGQVLSKTVSVSGTGVGGAGAVVNSGGAIYDSSGGLTPNLTLTGDTLLSYPNRWDLGSPTGVILSTGGNPYNLTLNSSSGYFEWRNVHVDPQLANITLLAGSLGYTGASSAGNPTNSLIITSGASLVFYSNDGSNAYLNKQIIMSDSATIQNGGGASVIGGPVVLTNSNGSQYCSFNIGGTSLTLSNSLSGNGILYDNGGGSTLILSGASPAFTGGVLLYQGSLSLTGSIGSGITSQSGTTVSGAGSAAGLVDVSGVFLPGAANVAGTFTASGLTLEGSAQLTMDLTGATTVGGGVNDLVQVNGDLTVNGNTLSINPIGGSLSSGAPYTLLTYTGNLNGGFSGVSTVAPSRYTLTLTNITTTTPKQIAVLVSGTGGGPASLVWNNAGGNGEWDVQASQNWSNRTAMISPDQFYSLDTVLFDDSILGAANPATNIDIAGGVIVIPTYLTNSATVNYTIGGSGKISGGATLVKQGPGTLAINTTNDFTGPTIIAGGTVVIGGVGALGGTNGLVTITNGGTLNLNGYGLVSKSFVVGGAGVNSNGVIDNTNLNASIYDNGSGLTQIRLTNDATFGGTSRWDLGGDSGATLSTGGQPFNLSLTGTSYREWDNVAVDTNLANINILEGQLGVKGTTTLGNPADKMTIFPGAQMIFYGGSGYAKIYDAMSNGTILCRQTGPTFNLTMILEAGSIFGSVDNVKQITGPVSLLGLVHFEVGNAACTFSNVISGPGGFYMDAYDSNPLIFSGTNTYSGPTELTGSGLTLELLGNGSIADSSFIYITGGSTLNASARNDGTLTLAAGQTLGGSGAITGQLLVGPGATVEPGTNGVGILSVSGAATLQGVASFGVGAGVTNVLSASSIAYGDTLNLNFAPGTLAAGNSFKLFNASTYSGAFSSLSPSTPGPNLAWNTNALTTSGVLSVVTGAASPTLGGISISGSTLTFSGTGGTPDGSYRILSSTNLVLPTLDWTQVGGGTFDANGNFDYTGTVDTNGPAHFYILGEP